MIDLANRYKPHGRSIEYVVHSDPDLALFAAESFDYIQTLLVLQHMHPQYQLNYLREFARVLKPGGLLVAQIPSLDYRVASIEKIDGLVPPEEARTTSGMSMHAIPSPMVIAHLHECGLTVRSTISEPSGTDFLQTIFFATKDPLAKPGFTATWGFARTLEPMAHRARELLVQNQNHAWLKDYRFGGDVDSEASETALMSIELERVQQELKTVLATRAWKWGSALSLAWNRLRGGKS